MAAVGSASPGSPRADVVAPSRGRPTREGAEGVATRCTSSARGCASAGGGLIGERVVAIGAAGGAGVSARTDGWA